MWSEHELIAVIDMTENEKQYIIDLLLDEVHADSYANTLRDLIVSAVSTQQRVELWTAHCDESAQDLALSFNSEAEIFKTRIREHGELIFTSS